MSEPEEPAEKVRTFPTSPGVYLMKDAVGRVIYVGKAVNLRNRASSYFTKAAAVDPRASLGKALGRPTIIPVPAFALRLAFGEGADELLLCSQKMSAQKLLDSGFKFKHPKLVDAANWVVGKTD